MLPLVCYNMYGIWLWYVTCVLCVQSCPTLCDPMDCSSPGSSVHGISQARILEWVAITFSRGSSRPRDRTCISCVSCVIRQILLPLSHLLCARFSVNSGYNKLIYLQWSYAVETILTFTEVLGKPWHRDVSTLFNVTKLSGTTQIYLWQTLNSRS